MPTLNDKRGEYYSQVWSKFKNLNLLNRIDFRKY